MCVWVITVKRRNMDSEEGEVSDTVPPTQITGDPTEAAKPSPDKTEPSSRRRGSKRSVKTAVSSPDAGDSVSGVRVLRARGAGCGRTKVNESKNATCKQHPKRVNRGRGRPVGPRSKNTQPTIKKSTAKKASKHSLGPKPSKGRDVTQATTACKPEAELKALSCGGKETDSLRGGNDDVADPDAALDNEPSFIDDPNDLIYKPETKKEKPRRHTMSRQKEVKIEELEKEEDEDDIKKEESTDIVVQSEEPPRKRGRLQKDDKVPRLPKQRKKPPVQYVRCEIEGCGTVLAHPRYLQHHIKYQHLLKKKYVCDHPSCGRLFRLQKQLLRHAKHHTDQRDYICEYCARAFKSSHNLAVHRMIHTGEKPIQCEICGFTCRQKASLNWHMKKHDAESSYQFSCSICGKKFEKKDSVVAHKAKSHPEVLIAEALAANGGTVISTPTPTSETVPGVTPTQETVPVLNPAPETQSIKPSVSQENQEVVNSTLTPLQQVVLAPQTQLDGAQSQFLPLPTNQQQTPTLVHLSTPFSSINHPQLIQLSTLPSSTVTSMAIVDPQSTLLTLSSVTSASLAPQAMQWARGGHEVAQPPGEGELWDRVVVGADHQDVGEMMWEGNEQKRKEEEGIVWEREGGRQILLQCAEVHGDSLM